MVYWQSIPVVCFYNAVLQISKLKSIICFNIFIGNINHTPLDVYFLIHFIDQHSNSCGIVFLTFQEIPQQMNGSDCGMFTCKYAEYITKDKPITFTQVGLLSEAQKCVGK